jgi:hypothetical protein
MNATVTSALVSEVESSLREIVEIRVDRQMATVHAADVARLVASGMTVAEIRARLIAKVMGEER